MSCALSSSLNLSSPTLECKENPYLAHAVEKYHKIGKNHGNLKSRKNVNQLQTVAKKSNFGPRCRPKTKLKAGFMIFRTGSSNLMRKKIKLVLRMTKESTVTKFSIKIDHELPRTPESDIWRCISPYHQPWIGRNYIILPRKSPKKAHDRLKFPREELIEDHPCRGKLEDTRRAQTLLRVWIPKRFRDCVFFQPKN